MSDETKRDLFSEDETFNEIDETSITFPIYVKSYDETRYIWYKNERQYEEISINKTNESFAGALMFGFNEHLINFCGGDLKIWIHTLLRVHTQIDEQEYNTIFERLINGRLDFFSDEIHSQYIERELSERQKTIKHKWKPIGY